MILTTNYMKEYGYLWDGMIPVSKNKALKLMSQGYQVYLLYSDNTESAADSIKDITNYVRDGGLLGIEK